MTKSEYTIKKQRDGNYQIYFRGSRTEGPPVATRQTAMKYIRLMEAERRKY